MAKIKPEPRIFIAALVLMVLWFFGQRYLSSILSEPTATETAKPARLLADPTPAAH